MPPYLGLFSQRDMLVLLSLTITVWYRSTVIQIRNEGTDASEGLILTPVFGVFTLALPTL